MKKLKILLHFVLPPIFGKVLKILLQFILALLGSFVFIIILVNLTFNSSWAPTSSVHGYEEKSLEDPINFIAPVVIAFGPLFGIWMALKLAHEETNYFYLCLAATFLAVIMFLFQSLFYNLLGYYSGLICMITFSGILTIVANLFISKQTR